MTLDGVIVHSIPLIVTQETGGLFFSFLFSKIDIKSTGHFIIQTKSLQGTLNEDESCLENVEKVHIYVSIRWLRVVVLSISNQQKYFVVVSNCSSSGA